MNSLFKRGSGFLALSSLLIALFANSASAGMTNGTENSDPVMGGYDPVAYFEMNKPMRGSGFHTATYNGGVYLFASKEHKKMFESNPGKYAPQYGGYCAYGVAVGKKFYSDPNRWKIVGGKLYLNLDQGIQDKWNEDVSGYITTANSNWKKIAHKHPAEL